MFTDIHGTRRLRVCLHCHTTLSDGLKTPAEAAEIYRAEGYDAVAFTDHWVFGEGWEAEGFTVLSGIEYDVAGHTGDSPVLEVYHIVGVGMTREPAVSAAWRNLGDGTPVRERALGIMRAIREAGGLAVLAHPAWSLNTPTHMMAVGAFDATEIYNSVSDWGMSDRPYSGVILDQLASEGVYVPLLATDDTHYYDGDHARGAVLVEAEAVESLGLVEAIRQERFYAGHPKGPEIHLERLSDTEFRLTCTPAVKLAFLSNAVWVKGRMVRGENLTEATYTLKPHETYLRAEVTDAEGRTAYSRIIPR